MRMKIRNCVVVCVTASALSAWGAGNALWRAEQSCTKYPTPSARVDCEKKLNDDQTAFEKAQQKEKADAKSRDGTLSGAKKKNDLCFKRASTGETVCPN